MNPTTYPPPATVDLASEVAPILDAIGQLRRRLEDSRIEPMDLDMPVLGYILDALHRQCEQADEEIREVLRQLDV